MNLWAKRAGLLFSAAVLIFLISCEDDSYLLGFKGKTKFKGRYQELVFDGDKSSVLLIDSVFTDQYDVSANPVAASYRYLIGQYIDPSYGTVGARFYVQYLPDDNPGRPTYFNRDKELVSSLVLDSTTVQLLLDFYAYGPKSTIDPVVDVYALQNLEPNPDTLSFYQRYFNTSVLTKYDPFPVGQLRIKKFSSTYSGSSKFRPLKLTDLKLEEQLDKSASYRDTIMLQGKLDFEFGRQIFNWIASHGDTALISDELVTEFRSKFPGLALISSGSSRIIGINPLNAFSRFTFHYHTPTKDSVATSLYFTPFPWVSAAGFTNITTDRTGGLSSISEPYQRFIPSNNAERYIQDGCGVITEVDLAQFYNFIDTLEDIVINSAEISLEVSDYPAGLDPIPNLYAVLMKKDGDMVVPLDSAVEEDVDKMIQLVGNVYTDLKNFGIANELSAASPLTLSYDKDAHRYRGYATLFFQRLFNNKDKPEYMVEHIGFYPATAPILKIFTQGSSGSPLLKSGVGNTVNRSVLKTSGIKLKLYYTVPNKPNLE